MMKILGWDTSSKTGALVAAEWLPGDHGPRILNEWSLSVAATHSEKLLWASDQMLTALGWKLSDLDAIAVGVGPGSFTGLRIGVTAARTLAHELQKPLFPISSLAALARPAAEFAMATSGSSPLVIAATDACKGEVFALWGRAAAVRDCVNRKQGDSPGIWKAGVTEAVLPPEELARAVLAKLKSTRGLKWVAVGEAFARYPEIFSKLPENRRIPFTDPSAGQVQGRFLARLAWESAQVGSGLDAIRVFPNYLRASDAEIKLKAGRLKPSPSQADALKRHEAAQTQSRNQARTLK